MKCSVCGKEALQFTMVDSMCICDDCHIKHNATRVFNNKPLNAIGWICPVCGRGLSPLSSFCPCMGYPNYNVTCQTT
jgi:hypothetical protein